MKSKKEELGKYLKSSPIEKNIEKKEIGLELKTNFEALQEGTFPEKLLEEKQFLNSFKNNEIMGEIEKKHAEILDKRPLPNLLESAELIDSFKEVKSPTMGKLYEEKKEIKKEKDNFFARE
ncbi:MAG: hypothetical protein CMB30_03350 [Euryarchaeota archaeon]|nr:hypothetical protein [Euryarchaeota archaeon]